MQKFYNDLADWWHLISDPVDYAEEVDFFRQQIPEIIARDKNSYLELGSGGGNNATHFKQDFDDVVLTDLSNKMLRVSHNLNPECDHIKGDMRSLRLGRAFDFIFVHDAIDYILSLGDLQLVFETAYVHCKPDGVAMFVPDFVCETFRIFTDSGGHDADDGRTARLLEWNEPIAEDGITYKTHYVFALYTPEKPMRLEHEIHTLAVFPRADWLRLLHATGFEAHTIRDNFGRDIFIARKPAL
jgi:SAM-dependent methyltransferase